MIGRRLDQLSESCNLALEAASAVGRDFDLPLLGQVAGMAEDQLLAVAQEAVAARILRNVPQAPRRYTFAHALTRDTLYEELDEARRRQLHRALGEALERLHRTDIESHLPALAHHFLQAGSTDTAEKAVTYARRAGRQAMALYAYEDAAAHFQRAIEGLELLVAPNEALRCDLLLAFGDAQMKAGAIATARETLLRAADAARQHGLSKQLGEAALGFAGPWVGAGFAPPHLLRLLEEACEALDREESALRAMLLARLAVELQYTTGLDRRSALSGQAVEMARRAGDTAALAYALNGQYYAIWGAATVDQRLAVTEEMLRLAETAHDLELELQARHWRTFGLLERGDIDGVDREIASYGRLAEELRQPVHLYRTAARRAMRALLDGRLEESERLVHDAFAIGQRAQDPNAVYGFTAQLFALRREQGRLCELEEPLRGLAEQFPAAPAWRCALAALHLETGQEGVARAGFERLAAREFADIPHDANWLPALALVAPVCAAVGDRNQAGRLYDLLEPFAEQCVVAGAGAVYNGACSHYLAILAASLERWREAIAHFEEAMATHAAMGARPWLARTQYEFARALLARGGAGDRATAVELASRSLATAQELGLGLTEHATALVEQLGGAASSAGSTSFDAMASATASERPVLREHAAPDGTVTVLFTDIEGSTSLNERLGDARWMEVLRAHHAIVHEQVREHRGHIVKTQGDGLMVAFDSARRALQCAVAVQRTLTERAGEQADGPISVRMGLHAGEAMKEADDFYGRTINLAARIAGRARGGEILASPVVRELARGTVEIDFDGGREVTFKGFADKQRIFGVRWRVPRVEDG